MRINELCGDCKFFEHDCNDGGCAELCSNKNMDIKDNFYDSDDKITECKGFEKYVI